MFVINKVRVKRGVIISGIKLNSGGWYGLDITQFIGMLI